MAADRRGDRISIPECANWTEEQVGEWIESLGLPQYKVGLSTSSQVDVIFVSINLPGTVLPGLSTTEPAVYMYKNRNSKEKDGYVKIIVKISYSHNQCSECS